MQICRFLILILAFFALGNAALGIEKTRTIKLAAVDLGPYVSEAAETRGFFYQIVAQVFKDAGYTVEIEFFPSLRAKELVASGEYDALIPAFEDIKSDKFFVLSAPIFESQLTRIKLKSFHSPEKSRKAVARDSFYAPGKDLSSDIAYTETEKTSQLIDMLNLNRIDMLVADQLVAAEILIRKRPHLLKAVEFSKPPLQTRTIHIAFSRKIADLGTLVGNFDRSLAQMKKSGEYEKLLARYGFETPIRPTSKDIVLSVGIPPNIEMEDLASLTPVFEKQNPGIKIQFHPMNETTLRRRSIVSMVLDDGYFDVVSIGPADLAFFAKRDWIQPIKPLETRYDFADILPKVRETLTLESQLYGLPFYGETTMTYYRKDLFQAKSLKMPAAPNYSDIRRFAEKLHDPAKGIYGICLRGKKGWKMGVIANIVHSFGWQFFDSKWQPQFTHPKFKEAVAYFIDLANNFAPPEITTKTYAENLKLFAEGHCAMWVDATVAASTLFDPKLSSVSDKIALAESPVKEFREGSQWLWTWNFAITHSTKHKAAALKFIQWATSKDYIALSAKEKGWLRAPPGTRLSTYSAAYTAEAPFAPFVLNAIEKFKPLSDRFPDTPYIRTRYADIPEWNAIMANLDSHLTEVLNKKEKLDTALSEAQKEAWQMLYQAGYFKDEKR